MPYAERTKVDESRSRTEIERVLSRYGADQFMYGWQNDRAVIGFRATSRMIRIVLPFDVLPKDAKKVAVSRWEQERRRRWRALGLVIKAKLESVASNIATFEEEFMPWIVLPDGSTVGEFMLPQIAAAYDSGDMPRNLLALPPGKDR